MRPAVHFPSSRLLQGNGENDNDSEEEGEKDKYIKDWFAKQVDKYGALSRESVAFEYVPLDALSASCTYVREDKLLDLEPVFQQYAEQQVPVFAPCTRWSTKLKTILLPPIVERHDSQLVVVEGSHRIWHLQQGRAGLQGHQALPRPHPRFAPQDRQRRCGDHRPR